jgi:hypothetical protein
MQRNSTDDDPTGIKHELSAMRRRLSALQLENLKDKARINYDVREPTIPANVWAVGVVMTVFVIVSGFFLTM